MRLGLVEREVAEERLDREKKVNVLVQVSLEPLDELTEHGVPQIWKFVPKEDDRKVAELVVSQQVFQRSYIAAARRRQPSRSTSCARRSTRP